MPVIYGEVGRRLEASNSAKIAKLTLDAVLAVVAAGVLVSAALLSAGKPKTRRDHP